MRYYESHVKLKKCRDGSLRRQYKLGGSVEDHFPVGDLQVKLKMNVPDKKKFATIDHYSGDKLKHWVKRWLEAARRDLRAGDEGR